MTRAWYIIIVILSVCFTQVSCTEDVVLRIDQRNLEELNATEKANLYKLLDAIYKQIFPTPNYSEFEFRYLPLMDGVISNSTPHLALQNQQQLPFVSCQIMDQDTTTLVFSWLKYHAKRELRIEDKTYRITNCTVAYLTKNQIESIPDGKLLVAVIPLGVEISHHGQRILGSSYIIMMFVFFSVILLSMRFSYNKKNRMLDKHTMEALKINSQASLNQATKAEHNHYKENLTNIKPEVFWTAIDILIDIGETRAISALTKMATDEANARKVATALKEILKTNAANATLNDLLDITKMKITKAPIPSDEVEFLNYYEYFSQWKDALTDQYYGEVKLLASKEINRRKKEMKT